MRTAVGRNRAEGVAPLIKQDDQARRLHDLAWRAHPRDAERLAIERWIVELPLVGEELYFFRQLRLVRRLVRFGRLSFLRGAIHLIEDAFVIRTGADRQQGGGGV